MKNQNLHDILLRNTEHHIQEIKDETRHNAAIFAKSFGEPWAACFENGDQNGKDLGCAYFNNDISHNPISKLVKILKSKAEFQILIDKNTHEQFSHFELEKFIEKFIENLGKSLDLDTYFENEDE